MGQLRVTHVYLDDDMQQMGFTYGEYLSPPFLAIEIGKENGTRFFGSENGLEPTTPDLVDFLLRVGGGEWQKIPPDNSILQENETVFYRTADYSVIAVEVDPQDSDHPKFDQARILVRVVLI